MRHITWVEKLDMKFDITGIELGYFLSHGGTVRQSQ